MMYDDRPVYRWSGNGMAAFKTIEMEAYALAFPDFGDDSAIQESIRRAYGDVKPSFPRMATECVFDSADYFLKAGYRTEIDSAGFNVVVKACLGHFAQNGILGRNAQAPPQNMRAVDAYSEPGFTAAAYRPSFKERLRDRRDRTLGFAMNGVVEIYPVRPIGEGRVSPAVQGFYYDYSGGNGKLFCVDVAEEFDVPNAPNYIRTIIKHAAESEERIDPSNLLTEAEVAQVAAVHEDTVLALKNHNNHSLGKRRYKLQGDRTVDLTHKVNHSLPHARVEVVGYTDTLRATFDSYSVRTHAITGDEYVGNSLGMPAAHAELQIVRDLLGVLTD